MPLRFHWSLSQAGDPFRRARATGEMSGLPNFEAQVDLCRRAEDNGIESVLMAFGYTRPDPVVLSAVLATKTRSIKFMVACRAGVVSPTAFVQQINTLSAVAGGRVCVNMVAGHTPRELAHYGDMLPHDDRFARLAEFLTVCHAFWRRDGEVNFRGSYYCVEGGRLNTPFVADDRQSPEVYVGGNSPAAGDLAARHADCWWRFAGPPDRLRPLIAPVLERGKEVGLLVSLLIRPSRTEAVQAAEAMVKRLGPAPKAVQREFVRATDSVAYHSTLDLAEGDTGEWPAPSLWTGAVPYLGAPAIALVGSPVDVATALLEYKRIGISQFLFSGWPDAEEVDRFGRDVLPLVRAFERQEGEATVG